MKFLFSVLALLFILAGCQSSEREQASENDEIPGLNADTLAQDIMVLSSDSFQGRKPFTAGEEKTVSYLVKRFKEIGLEPGNGDSYIQEVPMVNIQTKADPNMQVQTPSGNMTLKGFDDYVIWTEKTDPVVSFDQDELVFAGYGVVAPERNWNDYEGLDVKGKIVMVIVNDPGYGIDSTLFRGDTMTYYGRWTYKFEEAARQGAKGCLVIHNTKAASYPFSVVQNNWNGSRLHLDNRGKDVKYCDIIGWVTGPAAIKLLNAAGYDSSILKKAATPGFKGMPLNTKLTTSISVTSNYNTSKNVIGKITGSKHPDEYMIYSAHWDHLGIGKPDESGDSIYNGALDNASGTAGLLQLANAFTAMKEKPERTIIFLSVTAEEQGLWGSAYYAENPVYPLAKTVGVINMDGLNNIGPTRDLIIIGKGQSVLEDYLEDAAKSFGRVIAFEDHPEAGLFYRSDHFNFAKKGVPAVFPEAGIEVIGKPEGYGKKLSDEYTSKHYHRPSDEYNKNWNLDGAIDDLKLFFLVGKRMSQTKEWPGWKQGSEFSRKQ